MICEWPQLRLKANLPMVYEILAACVLLHIFPGKVKEHQFSKLNRNLVTRLRLFTNEISGTKIVQWIVIGLYLNPLETIARPLLRYLVSKWNPSFNVANQGFGKVPRLDDFELSFQNWLLHLWTRTDRYNWVTLRI